VKVVSHKDVLPATSPAVEAKKEQLIMQLLKTYQNQEPASKGGFKEGEGGAVSPEEEPDLRKQLARVTNQRDNLRMRVHALEGELSRVREECGTLSRRCMELEHDQQEAELLITTNYMLSASSQGFIRRNQLLERKLMEEAAKEGGDVERYASVDEALKQNAEKQKVMMEHCSRSLKRTEEWVMMHLGVEMESLHEQWEGSLGSSVWDGTCSVGAHINPDDSASQDGAWQRVAVGAHVDASDTDIFGSKSLERMLDVSKRMCPTTTRNRADKVARSPWKSSIDVNPVYQSQMLFGRLMGNMAAKAAASGPSEDVLSREAFY